MTEFYSHRHQGIAGRSNIELMYAVIRKEQVYWFCGSGFPAAIVFIRGWKAAPTGVLFSNLGLPDKRMKK